MVSDDVTNVTFYLAHLVGEGEEEQNRRITADNYFPHLLGQIHVTNVTNVTTTNNIYILSNYAN